MSMQNLPPPRLVTCVIGEPFLETCHNVSWSCHLAGATLTHDLSLPAAVPGAAEGGLMWVSSGLFHVRAQLARDGLVGERGQVACGVVVSIIVPAATLAASDGGDPSEQIRTCVRY
ncbi:MAG: hypothetical protein ACRDQ4_05640 [Pseudonocardiaceae bacterium]